MEPQAQIRPRAFEKGGTRQKSRNRHLNNKIMPLEKILLHASEKKSCGDSKRRRTNIPRPCRRTGGIVNTSTVRHFIAKNSATLENHRHEDISKITNVRTKSLVVSLFSVVVVWIVKTFLK